MWFLGSLPPLVTVSLILTAAVRATAQAYLHLPLPNPISTQDKNNSEIEVKYLFSHSLNSREYTFHRTATRKCIYLFSRTQPVHPHSPSSPKEAVLVDVFTNPSIQLDPEYASLPPDLKPVEEVRVTATIESPLARARIAEMCTGGIISDNGFPTYHRDVRLFQETEPEFIVQFPTFIPLGRGSPIPVPPPPPPPLEIIPLYTSSNSTPGWLNRVNFVFFGDGYTEEEKPKFLQDAQRLANDLVINQTLAAVNPLINIYGAFSPSNESGIGTGGVPKDTVYGLYRDGTQLRAVYASNKVAGVAACLAMGRQCSFPILLGNDPLYGGLGGFFTITTSSIENGALVLRHELGHSIIPVGEEYDGGFAYYGPNADDTLEDIKWSHWLSSQEDKDEEETSSIRAERSVMPIQGYPWTLLNHTASFKAPFISSGSYSRHVIRFSLSGLPEKENIKVLLDGEDLGWTPKEGLGVDRWHYDVLREMPLEGGEHVLEFALQESGNHTIAQLCSFEILEFGDETEFNVTAGNIGAYPTYSIDNKTTYRPTNEDCLMRIVTTPDFCAPCLEGLWHSLLSRVNLVDSWTGSCHEPDEDSDKYHRTLEVNLLPLAQYRDNSTSGAGFAQRYQESFNITWLKEKEHLPQYDNSTRIIIDDNEAGIVFQVSVEFKTQAVRKDPDQLLTSNWWLVAFGKCEDVFVRRDGMDASAYKPAILLLDRKPW